MTFGSAASGTRAVVDETLSALPALLDEAARIPGIAMSQLDRLRDKVREHVFNLVVCGEFKRGKSSLINALLGAEVLPTAVVPLTSVVTVLAHADVPHVEVAFDSGEHRTIPPAALPDYVTERGNPGNAKGVREVAVGWPAPWLAKGLRLVDTPGIGSVHQHNTELTHRYLPEADAVIFVASVDQPFSRNELDFLAEIRGHSGKVFCVLNKIDHLSDAELAESTAFATHVLREALGEEVPVFPLSARLALQGRLANDAALLARSRLNAFDAALRCFLAEDRGAVWVRSISQHLRRLVDEVSRSAQFELAALSTPLDVLDTKLAAFASKKAEALQARSDFDALLDADGRKLVRERIAPEIDALKKRLVARLNTLLQAWYTELRPGGSAALQAGLEARTVDEIRRALDAWRAEQDTFLTAAFDQMCGRYSGRVHQIIDELLTFSAGLFDIPVAASAPDSPLPMPAGFSYKFWEMPPSLLLMRNAFVLALPGVIGHPILLRDAQRRAGDLVSMQAGRLSYDFEQRVKRNLIDFRREMAEQVDSTVYGIEAAIEKGSALRAAGEQQAAARRIALASVLERASTLRSRLV
jgi:GTP-binding protein EngB required for normal cell division